MTECIRRAGRSAMLGVLMNYGLIAFYLWYTNATPNSVALVVSVPSIMQTPLTHLANAEFSTRCWSNGLDRFYAKNVPGERDP